VTVEKDQVLTAEYWAAREISLNRSRLNFGVSQAGGDTSSQTFYIGFTGGTPLSWSVADNVSWLTCSPISGTGNANVTVSVNAAGLAPGTYAGTITISAPLTSNSPQTIAVNLVVYTANTGSEPFGYFETPREGYYVYSSIPVTGWVLDDIEVVSVKIYREEGGNLVYIGDAIFVDGARPDVEQVYPGYPYAYKAGWGYMMLTNFLPNGGNGTFKLHAVATDKEGHQVTLGIKTFVCDNASAVKPFGAIDIPGQGGIAKGTAYRNQGWVLTPLPNVVPKDGHTLMVWIDGTGIGNPAYNIYRPDVAALFPGYANSSGALAYFDFDTTAYENGVHTMQWTAVDSAGNVDGIGSRYFAIQNPGPRQPAASQNPVTSEQVKKASYNIEPVKIKKGWEQRAETLEIYPDRAGTITIEINQLERVEIHLSKNPGNVEHVDRKVIGAGDRAREWQGFLLVGEQLRKLPIGSRLDTGKGIFYWMPGPGFIGTYRLVFVGVGQNREMNKKIIIIKLLPR
jgi:hypothetical protein